MRQSYRMIMDILSDYTDLSIVDRVRIAKEIQAAVVDDVVRKIKESPAQSIKTSGIDVD